MLTNYVSILETHFFEIFQLYCLFLFIMVINMNELDHHLLLTEKKEPH